MVVPGLNHGSTGYGEWLEETSCALADADERRNQSDKPCRSSFTVRYMLGWEPYVVASKTAWRGMSGEGMFDRRFLRRGWDKASFLFEAAACGYSFRTISGVFLAHSSEAAIATCPVAFGSVFCALASAAAVSKVPGWSATARDTRRSVMAFSVFVHSLANHLAADDGGMQGDVHAGGRNPALCTRRACSSAGMHSTCMVLPSDKLARLPVSTIHELLERAYQAMNAAVAHVSTTAGVDWWIRPDKSLWSSFAETWCAQMPVVEGDVVRLQETGGIVVHAAAKVWDPLGDEAAPTRTRYRFQHTIAGAEVLDSKYRQSSCCATDGALVETLVEMQTLGPNATLSNLCVETQKGSDLWLCQIHTRVENLDAKQALKLQRTGLLSTDAMTHEALAWTVLLSVSSGFLDLFENWLYWFRKLELGMKVVVIAEDQESLQRCRARGEVEVRTGHTLQDADADTDYESGPYKQVVSRRAGYILSLFESQRHIIYSDVDTVWLRDPRPHLTGHHDLWMSVDEENPLTLCTGFMAMLPTVSTLSVLRAWHDELTRQPQLNQPLFNRLLDQHPVRVGRLDRKLFPSGDLYFGKEGVRATQPLSKVFVRRLPGAVIVHNNWIIGKESKVKRFQVSGLWHPPSSSSEAEAAAEANHEQSLRMRALGTEWRTNITLGRQEALDYYLEAISNIHTYNRHVPPSAVPEPLSPLRDISAYVLCHVRERCASVERMVRAAGFDDVEFVHTSDIESIDLAALEAAGSLSDRFNKGASPVQRLKYIANALDYGAVIKAAIAANHSWVAVFEDDIILTTSPGEAAERIGGAVAGLPTDADTLHMEYCFEACGEALFSPRNLWASTAHQPFCSAGILFSSQGLRRLNRSLFPIQTAMDDLIAESCLTGRLNCFKLRKPAFAQDAYWASGITPAVLQYKEQAAWHQLHWDVPLCREEDFNLDRWVAHPHDHTVGISKDARIAKDGSGPAHIVVQLQRHHLVVDVQYELRLTLRELPKGYEESVRLPFAVDSLQDRVQLSVALAKYNLTRKGAHEVRMEIYDKFPGLESDEGLLGFRQHVIVVEADT